MSGEIDNGEIIAEWWGKALEEYSRQLGRKTKAPKAHRSSLEYVGEPALTTNDLLESARKASSTFTSHRADRGRLAKIYSHIVDQIRIHSAAIDVFIQQQPSITAVVWGSVRLILQTVIDKEEASKIAGQGILEILGQIDRWSTAATIFATNSRVQDVVVKLYVETLGFLALAKEHLGLSGLQRFGESVIGSKREKLHSKLRSLKSAAKLLDLEVTTEFHRHYFVTSNKTEMTLREMTKRAEVKATHELLQTHKSSATLCSPALSKQHFEEAETATITSCFSNMQAHRDLDGVLQWLRPSAGGQVVQQADEPMQGTHQWINSNICITEWLDVESQKILFVEGRPGFGKSVLAARLAEICRQRSDSPLVILYEFSNQSGPSTLAASILSQLLHCPEIQPDDKALKLIVTELQELGNENRLGPSGCRFIKLWDLALRALAIPRTKWAQVFVIVDGLDQYDFNTNISLMGFLESLKDSSRVARVRVAVFTRPQCEILSFASSFPSRCLQVSLTEELLASDIELFAANKFDSLQIPSRFNDMTLERIRQDAKGSFLWAKLLLKYLSEPWTEIEYLERLRGCPPDLSSTYDTMLEDGAALFTKDTPGAAARHRFSQQRRKTLLLVCEAREPLSLVEIGRAVSIGHYNVEKTLMDRCKPLLFVSEARLHFIHASAKEYLTDQSRLRFVTGEEGAILFRASDSHRSLAWECLSCLLDPEYAEKGRIGYFIHRSFGKFLQEELIPEPSRGLSFRYAARHWDFHLTAIEDPDAELLETTRQFIDSFQFAFWSEWSIERTGNTSRVFDVWRALRTWTASLPKDKQALICLDDYFVGPYLALSEAYRDAEAEDKVLQWLALMRVGRYYVDKGETEKAMPIRREVKDGLIAVLGTSHPLTLRARTDYGLSQTFEGNYQEAYDEFKAIVEIEENSYGETSKELYRTLMAMGETELYLLLFHDSVSTQEKAALGFLKFYSQDSKQYLSARMWLCYPLIELGKLDVAFEILFYVFQKRTEGYGPDDMFAASSRFSMGGIQRKQGNREAIKSLEEAFRVRHQLYNLTSMWALDFAIELLIAYRDFGEEAKAAKLLEDLDSEGAGDRLFNRHCQVEHVRSLLRWDSGKRDQAIDLLQGLLIAADREDYNRALLWIALDLALMLRARGGEGDNHQAEANFDHILVDCKLSSSSSHRCVRQRLIDKKSGRNSGNAETHSVRVIEALASWRSGAKDKEQHTSDDKSAREEVYNSGDMEPDPPHTLRLAEKALTLVRNRKFAEVDELMREEQFDWFRVQDLWLWSGGPAADTSWMRPPLGVTSVIFHGFTAAAPTAAEEYG